MKLNISMNDDLLSRADDFAKQNYLSRSGLIAVALNDYLNSKEALLQIGELTRTMRQIANSGNVDDATMQKLKEFEDFYHTLTLG